MSENIFEQLLAASSGPVGFMFFIAILWWVLCVVLFFKIWGMTNDISEIKTMLREWLDLEHPLVKNDDKNLKDKTN